jgi:hypothetical protein
MTTQRIEQCLLAGGRGARAWVGRALIGALALTGATAAFALNTGDVALVRVNNGTDGFSFVALTNIPSGTVIGWTDNGWNSATAGARGGETVSSYTATTGLQAGAIVNVSASGYGNGGEQVFLFEGTWTAAASTTVASVDFFFGANWDNSGWLVSGTNSSGTSYLPPGLAEAAIKLGTGDQWYYTGITNGTKAELLAAITNTANWAAVATTASTYAGLRTGATIFTVLVGEPTVQASSVAFNTVQQTQMDVSWTAGDGVSRLVICRQGSAPSSGPVDGATYTADASFTGGGSALGDGKVVYAGSGTSFTLTGLSAGTTYYLQVYEFNGSGASVNYLTSTASGNPGSQATAAASFSTASDLIRAAALTEPDNVAYATYQAADITHGASIELARFTIRDGGATTDGDAVGTTLTDLTLAIANGGALRRVALYDGTTEIAEVAGGTSVSFSSLAGLVAADGGTKDFSVRATFNATATDNQQLQFTVTSATADAGGSTFAAVDAGGAASLTTGDRNRIEVSATKLVFTSVPASVTVAQDFTAAVEARDANENLDLDNTASVTITKASGSGTLSGGGAQSLVSGARSFTTLQIDDSGSFTLQAAGGGLTAATSGSITAVGRPLAISGYMPNTAGSDGPYEYVQLIALENVDFSSTPMCVVWCNNGTPTGNGWANGGAVTYKFNITSGTLNAGDVAYVGGSGKLINGAGSTDISGQTWLRSINTSTTGGDDGLGTSGGTTGNMGNGGSAADGVAVFVGTTITDSSVPVDAIFYGTGIGAAVVSGGTDGYVLPDNDLYDGGFLQSGSAFLTDPASGGFVKLSGVYNTTTRAWTTTRTGSTVSSPTTVGQLATGITLAAPAAEPTVQASAVSFANIASDEMDVSFTAGNGANRLVICRQGSAPSSGPVDASTYTADTDFGSGDALGGGFVVYNGSGNSFTLVGLSPSTTYHLQVYEYNGSGVNVNYLTSPGTDNPDSQATAAPANSTLSDIVRASGFTEPADVAYASYQATDITDANSIELARFSIRDGGGAADPDAFGTTLDALTLTVANGAALRRVALYDGTTEIAEVAGGASAVFSGLAGLVAADGGNKNFSVRATFNAAVTDNAQVQFTVASATANSGGSTFAAAHAGAAASDLTGDANRIEVTATKLAFSSVPAGVVIASNFTATVQARDANDNVDLDNTASVTITKATGSGTLTGGGAQSLASGVQSWTTLQIDTAGTFTLQAAGGGLTVAVSGSITATTGPTTLGVGDIAVIGYNTAGSPTDNLVLLVLRELGAGTVFYVNDNEIASAGGTTFTDLNETEAAFTVKPGMTIPAGTVLVLPWGGAPVDETNYTWNASSGGMGNNNEEIYVYTAAAITDTTPISFIYGVSIGTSSSQRPNGLTAGTTFIEPPPSGTAAASRYKIAGATYTSTTNGLLAAIGDVANNWETAASYTITVADWTFTIVNPAAEPTVQASTITFPDVQASEIDVAWTSGNGANRLVICREGSAPSSGPVDAVTYTADASFAGAGSALGGGKVVHSGSGNSFTLSGLNPATTYHLQVFEYNGSGTSINYLNSTASGNPNSTTTLSAGNDAQSDIARSGSFTEPDNVDYATYQASDLTHGTSIELARFSIRDGGGASDADAAATTLDALTFTVANGTALRRVALYDGTTEIAEVAGGASVIFSSLSGLVAADDGSKDFSVRASFNSTVTDNAQVSFTVASATAAGAGSIFASANAGGAASSTTGDRNRLEVTATALHFSSVPGTASVGVNFSATVQARDANGNVDLDSTASVTVTKATGSGTLTGGTAQNLVSGSRTFSTLQIDTAGTITLQAAAGGLTAATSGNIVASVAGTTLAAGDIAVIGYNTAGSPDNFAILVLKTLTEGTTFYVNDNEVAADGGTAFTDLGEREASFTVKAGQSIPAGTVIVLPWGQGAVSTATYDWSTTTSAGFGSNNEEIYLYTAADINATTPTAFIYGVRIGTSTSARPAGLVAGTTFITPPPSGTLAASRYKTSGAIYTGTTNALLAAIGDVANNWQTAASYTLTAGDWTFAFVTPAAEPTTQASGVNFANVTASQMDVSWSSGNGANRLVICRAGSAPASGPVDGVTYTADADFSGSGSSLGSGKVVYVGSGSSFTLTGLSAATTYYLQVYELNGSGGTENYLTTTSVNNPNSQATTSSGASALSDVVRASGFSEPVNVAYASYQATNITAGNSIELARFAIRDGAGSADADALGTTLTALTLNIANGAALRRVALYDGVSEVAELAGGASAAFTGLAGLVAADDGQKEFSVRATFAAAVTDNVQVVIGISAATASAAGSTFSTGDAGGASSDSAGDANRLEVTATKLAFAVLPTGVLVGQNFSATVQAQDALNNVDLDNTASVTITKSSGSGTFTGGAAQNLSAGSGSWPTLQIDTAGTIILQASGGGLTVALSASISATAALSAGDLAIIGRINNGSPDSFALLTLATIPAGTVVYFTDNSWSNATFRGSATDGDGNENLIKLTFNSAVGPGTIFRSSDTADARFTWATSGSIPFGGAATFANLSLGQSGEQIYAFQAANLVSNPLASASHHLFVLDDTLGFEGPPTDSSSQGGLPPGLSSNANTALSFAFSGNNVIGLNMMLAGAQSFATKEDWLAFINNAANWSTSGSTLPSGGVNFGATCDAGRPPLFTTPGDKTATAGSAFTFTILASDPTCTGPALSATGLPAGATFGYSAYGSNSIGTFSWTPGVSATGTYLVRFIATDSQPLSTSVNVRIYVRGSGEATNSAGVPVSQTNWSVVITNVLFGSSGNVTVQWDAVAGVTYDLYRSQNSFGSGMSWTKVLANDLAAGSVEEALVNGGATQQFFQVVPAGFSPSSNGVWGLIKPYIRGNAFTMMTPPLRSDRAFNGAFGASLAAALTGNNDGVANENGDEVFFLKPDGGWENLYLDASGTWRDSGGAVSTNVLRTGQGVLVQRNSGSAAQPSFVGQVGNLSQQTNVIAEGWSIIGLSEGKLMPMSTLFSDLPSGSLNASYAEESADLLIVLDDDGSWTRFQRMGNNLWYNLDSLTISTVSLRPGQAYYFYRVSGTGSLQVRF